LLAHAHDITKRESRDHERESPLHFRAVLPEPKQTERDQHRRRRRAYGQPGETIFVRRPTPRFGRSSRFVIHWPSTVVAGVSPATTPQPTRLPLQSQTILLQPPIKCAATQSQRFRRLPGVSAGTGQRFLNQIRFDFLQTHLFQPPRIAASR
jgi:hypothetical protein